MKIRSGFVSNSSTSSYVIMGVQINDDEELARVARALLGKEAPEPKPELTLEEKRDYVLSEWDDADEKPIEYYKFKCGEVKDEDFADLYEDLMADEVDEDDISAYMAQGSVSVGEGNLTLENIIIQKYVAFWLFQPIEAYNDYRRTNYPTLNNPVGPPPNRFPYTQDEVAANPNVPDRTIQNKVWWAE